MPFPVERRLRAASHVDLYGVNVRLITESAPVLDALFGALPPGATPVEPPAVPDRTYTVTDSRDDEAFRLLINNRPATRAATLADLLDFFRLDVRAFVVRKARKHLFVHAGVVGWNGAALVLPGPSYAGKTTLVAALVRQGAVYYSDDYALIDRKGRVHSYPTPLALRTADRLRKYLSPEAIGGERGEAPLPLGAVAFTEYVPDARFRPIRLTRGDAVLRLLVNTPCAREAFRFSVRRLSRAVPETCYAGKRGEAEETARILLKLASRDVSSSNQPVPLDHRVHVSEIT